MSKKDKEFSGMYIPLGLCFGVTFGIIIDNLSMGMCFGLLAGVILDNMSQNKKKEKED